MKAFVANSPEHFQVKKFIEQFDNGESNIHYVESQSYHSSFFQSIIDSDIYIGCIGEHFSYNQATIRMALNAVNEGVNEVLLLVPEKSDYSVYLEDKQLRKLKQIKFKNEKELVDIVKEKIYSHIA